MSKYDFNQNGINHLQKRYTRVFEWSWYHCLFWLASTSRLKLELGPCSPPKAPRRQAFCTWTFNFWKLSDLRCVIVISLWQRRWPGTDIVGVALGLPHALVSSIIASKETFWSSWASASPSISTTLSSSFNKTICLIHKIKKFHLLSSFLANKIPTS